MTPSTICPPHIARALGLVLACLLLGACATPPPSHVARIWPQGAQGAPVLGLSTEDGVLVLADPSYKLGDLFDMQFPVGNSRVDDHGELIRINDNLAIIIPLTSRLAEGRFAETPMTELEQLYVAVRDEDDEPVMEEVTRWRNGAHGDLIVIPDDDAYDFAARYSGAGVYVNRYDRWQIVGVLSGLVVEDSEPQPDEESIAAVGFIGLDEVARLVADRENYLTREEYPMRPDFEFGVKRQAGDIDIDDWRTMTAKPKPKTGTPPKKAAANPFEALFGTPQPTNTATPPAPQGKPADAGTLDFLELLQREAERASGGTGTDVDTDDADADGSTDADEAPAEDDGDDQPAGDGQA